jgi:hypothetical protein
MKCPTKVVVGFVTPEADDFLCDSVHMNLIIVSEMIFGVSPLTKCTLSNFILTAFMG